MSGSGHPRAERRRPSRGEISLGDAVAAAGRLVADEEGVASILEALGLAVEAVAPEEKPPTPPREPNGVDDDWETDDGSPEETPPQSTTSGEAIGVTVSFVDDDAGRPRWVDGASSITFGPFTAEVAVPPPLPEAQSRAAMVVACATRRPGRKLDVERLIARAVLLRPLAPPPVLSQLRTAASIQLLIDVGEAMEPYTADVAFLEDRFVDVAGADRVERHTFVGTPLRGVDRDVLTSTVEAWEPPPPRSLVVVISELGIGGPRRRRGRADAAEWRELAAEVAECGASLRILTPFGADRWPDGLADAAHVTNWESLADLVEHRA